MNYQDYGNGMRTAFDYDERGMARVVHSYHVPSGGNYWHRTYARDERDRITAWQKAEDGRGDRYGYDAEGQLTSAWYQAQHPFGTPSDARRSDSFAYDALGNRYGTNTVASRGAVNFSRRDNGLNQYASWSPSVINYEGNGVLIQEGMISSDFNALNQPTWMWANGMAQVMRFGYDPLGRYVKRWFGADDPAVNAATYLYYDGWNLIQEGGGPWAPSRLYAHGNRVDEVVVSFRNSTAEHGFHHYDARGHTILLTNGNAGLMEQYDYDAFGKPYVYSAGGTQLPDSPFGNRILFTGREWLKELGVYDFRHRHYQPELGRFLQPDPLQFRAGDYNIYRYCHNDPINETDPEGLGPNPALTRRFLQKLLSGSRRPFYNPRSLRGPVTPGSIWTRGKPNDAIKNLKGHWKDHREQFPTIKGPKEYAQTAHRELSNPTKDSYIAKDAKGDIAVYDPKTNTLTIADSNVVPRTMFKPDPAIHGRATNEQFVREQFPHPVPFD